MKKDNAETSMVAQNYSLSGNSFPLFFLGLEETLGREELEKLVRDIPGLLSSTGILSAREIKPVAQKLTENYGQTGARGLMMCSGRAAFKYLLKQEGKALGFEAPGFRFLPNRSKLKKGLDQIAGWMKRTYGDEIQVKNNGGNWHFELSDCHECEGVTSAFSMCDFTAGLLQEFLSWAGGGKFYAVHEVNCRAVGDESCCFAIDKFPLD
jgi:predicted hydrocarbon binding protein